MSNVLNQFLDKKKANSEYVSLEPGESAIMKIREIKMLTKAGYGGEEKETLRLIVDVETSEGPKLKKFDNSSAKFAAGLSAINADIGSMIKVTREGSGTATKYAVTLYQDPLATPSVPAAPTA